jgi:hypothetical protein
MTVGHVLPGRRRVEIFGSTPLRFSTRQALCTFGVIGKAHAVKTVPQGMILRTTLDDFYPFAALVDSSITKRVRFRKYT